MLSESLLEAGGQSEPMVVSKPSNNSVSMTRRAFALTVATVMIASVSITLLAQSTVMRQKAAEASYFLGLPQVYTPPVQLLDPCIVPSAPSVTPPRGTFAANRDSFVQRFFEQLGRNENTLRSALVYLQGGADEAWYYSDTDKLFRQESNFRYLTGFDLPGLNDRVPEVVIVPTVVGGRAVSNAYLFVERCDASCQVWNGEEVTLDQLRARYEVENIHWRSDMPSVLASLMQGRTTVYTLPNVLWARSAARSQLQNLPGNNMVLQRTSLPLARATKNSGEMTLMRVSSLVSAEAHKLLMTRSRTYPFEYSVQVDFESLTGSCAHVTQSYLSIAPASVRSAVLHYNINDKPINQSIDLVLVDAGSEFYGYGTDITRTWPARGTFTTEQAIVYNTVLRAQAAALALCRAGASWSDISRASNIALVQGLIDAGLVLGTVQNALAAGINSVFMPHGLGHYLGIDVHDSRYLSLSTLQAGMVVTVEPGCYFIPIQIANAESNPSRRQFLNFTRIRAFMGASTSLGGVRIEDVAHITAGGVELLSSAAPRSVSDIERTMATGAFTPSHDDTFAPWLAYPNQDQIKADIALSQQPELIAALANVETMNLEPLI